MRVSKPARAGAARGVRIDRRSLRPAGRRKRESDSALRPKGRDGRRRTPPDRQLVQGAIPRDARGRFDGFSEARLAPEFYGVARQPAGGEKFVRQRLNRARKVFYIRKVRIEIDVVRADFSRYGRTWGGGNFSASVKYAVETVEDPAGVDFKYGKKFGNFQRLSSIYLGGDVGGFAARKNAAVLPRHLKIRVHARRAAAANPDANRCGFAPKRHGRKKPRLYSTHEPRKAAARHVVSRKMFGRKILRRALLEKIRCARLFQPVIGPYFGTSHPVMRVE